MLATPGTLLLNSELGVRGIVFGTTQWGVWLLSLGIAKAHGTSWCRFQPSSASRFMCITKLDGWRAVRPRILSPCNLAKRCSTTSVDHGIVFEGTGGGTALAVHAAREGFKYMTKPFLDRMVRFAQIRFEAGQRPNTVEDVMRALILHYIPKATDSMIEAALAHRGPKRLEQQLTNSSVRAQGQNLDALVNCMDADDHLALQQAVKDAKPRMVSGGARKATAPGRAWVRKPVNPSMVGTLQEGRELLPQARGCTLSLDEVRFSRWTGTYPTPTPPHYTTKSYGPKTGYSSKQAMLFVVKRPASLASGTSHRTRPLRATPPSSGEAGDLLFSRSWPAAAMAADFGWAAALCHTGIVAEGTSVIGIAAMLAGAQLNRPL